MSEPRKTTTTVNKLSPSMEERLRTAANAASESMRRQEQYKFDAPQIRRYDDYISSKDMERIEAENARNGWGYTRPQTVRFIKQYLDGDMRSKVLSQYRFEDVNYHGLNRALDSGDAREVQEWLNKTYETKPTKSEKDLFKRFGL